MPFTFSHPAITAPLFRSKYFSISGLIAGSMAPDFEYFLRMDMKGSLGHSLGGILVFDLPVCLLLLFVFHLIIKRPLIRNLPLFLKSRLNRYEDFRWIPYFRQHLGVVIFSILLGTVTHLIWDGFTHHDGYFVQRLPVLYHLMPFAGKRYPYYHMLQHASSGLGLIAMIVIILKLPIDTAVKGTVSKKFWVFIFILTFIISIIRLSFMDHEIKIGHVIVVGLAAGMLSLLIACLLIPGKQRRTTDPVHS